MSDNWVVRNLENALETWNDKLTEIWGLLTATPEEFKGGKIWNVILDINGALQVIGTALLVLFFVVGVMKTCGSFAEVKKPEHALRLFIRFALAKGAITYGLDLMLSLFKIVQGTISTIMTSAGFGQANETTLPQEMITAIENCDFFKSIPLWAVSSDFSQIPVGATVYGYSSSKYGHVGIYIGNGMVAHNIGEIKIQSLESWIKTYKGFAWGWENTNKL